MKERGDLFFLGLGGLSALSGQSFFDNFERTTAIADCSCSLVEQRIARWISFLAMAFLVERGWWEL